MFLFRHTDALPDTARGAVVALGNFDGVHRGHAAVIAEARAKAKALGAALAVLTFEPHPRSVFQPDLPPFRLTPLRMKARAMAALGVDILVARRFSYAFSRRKAIDFLEKTLVSGLAARHVIAGSNFKFGADRQGDIGYLQRMGPSLGFSVSVAPEIRDETGLLISSSRIREALRQGDCPAATALLGRPFEIAERVRHGEKRGRQLGYPTANMTLGAMVRPAYGVYAVRAGVDQGGDTRWFGGVANLGIRPMYEIPEPLLETHLFDFAGSLYGKVLRVQLLARLRGEMKFDGIAPLIAQMDQDSAASRAVLAGVDPTG